MSCESDKPNKLDTSRTEEHRPSWPLEWTRLSWETWPYHHAWLGLTDWWYGQHGHKGGRYWSFEEDRYMRSTEICFSAIRRFDSKTGWWRSVLFRSFNKLFCIKYYHKLVSSSWIFSKYYKPTELLAKIVALSKFEVIARPFYTAYDLSTLCRWFPNLFQ